MILIILTTTTKHFSPNFFFFFWVAYGSLKDYARSAICILFDYLIIECSKFRGFLSIFYIVWFKLNLCLLFFLSYLAYLCIYLVSSLFPLLYFFNWSYNAPLSDMT